MSELLEIFIWFYIHYIGIAFLISAFILMLTWPVEAEERELTDFWVRQQEEDRKGYTSGPI